MDTHDMMDRDGYPTEKFHEWIDSIQWEQIDLMGIAQTIIDCWHFGHWGVTFKRMRNGHRTLHLSTGGWSGNEEIVTALRTTMWWSLCWEEHKRGGHYRFSIPCKR